MKQLPVVKESDSSAFAGAHVEAYLSTLAPTTRRTMSGCVANLRELAADLDTTDPMAWASQLRTRIGERYSHPGTRNLHMAAARKTIEFAWLSGSVSVDARDRVRHVLKSEKYSRLPAGRAVPVGEQAAAFQTISENTHAATSARDAAVMAVALGCGLRRAEIASLCIADVHKEATEASLSVLGNGNKQRRVPVANSALQALQAWLSVRGDHDGPLFAPVHRSGAIQMGRGITPQAVYGILAKSNIRPHDARRSYVTTLLDHGADVLVVAALAGHASTDTTRTYDRRGEMAGRRAAEMVHVPFPAHGRREGSGGPPPTTSKARAQ